MLGLLATLAVLGATPPGPCWHVPEDGRGFPTCFDAWDGVDLGGAGGLRSDGPFGELTFGVRLREDREGRKARHRAWLSLHHLLFGELGSEGGRWAVTGTLWEGLARRHLNEAALTLPGNPPVQVPFPFDVSLAGSVLRWERRAAEGDDWALEVVRFSALLDLVRATTNRFHLGVGPSAAWRWRQVAGAQAHDVTPLSAGQVVATLESQDGLWVLRGTGVAGWQLAPFSGLAVVFRARGDVALERVLFAVNDEPVVLALRARGAWADAGARLTTEWAVTAGLSMRLGSALRAP